MPQHPHPGQVAGKGAQSDLHRHRGPAKAAPGPDPGLAQRQREQRQHQRTDADLVEQQALGRHQGQSRAADHHRGQAPEHAAGQRQQVALPLLGRAVAAQAVAERQQHCGKGQHQPQPLAAVEVFALDAQRQQQRYPERCRVGKNGGARGAGVDQAGKDAGKFERKQQPRQHTGGQRAVAREQRNAAPMAPQPQQGGGAGKAQRRLKNRRQLGDGGFHQHLLEAPEHAAGQQQGDGQAVESGFAGGHSPNLAGFAPAASRRRASQPCATVQPCPPPAPVHAHHPHH